VANEKIWTGIPLEGQSKFTFWHVMFFAWFCNMAMHIGMADLSIFRYARKWYYGFTSAFGMFLGHYIAWIWLSGDFEYADKIEEMFNNEYQHYGKEILIDSRPSDAIVLAAKRQLPIFVAEDVLNEVCREMPDDEEET